MSFGFAAATWAAIGATAAVAGTVVAVKGADSARRTGNQANDAAKANALKTQQDAERANNKVNAKSPNTSALMAANLMAGKLGQGGTLLTGPQGIDPAQLTLGKPALLGGQATLGGG